MKFELDVYSRNVTAEEICDDLRKVATLLKKNSVTMADYRQHGRYSPSLAQRRFGSWFQALKEAGLDKTRHLNIDADDCITDLKNVAARLGVNAVTQEQYIQYGKYSPGPLLRHFGSWFTALKKAGLEQTRTLGVSKEQYFTNLEKMWIALGRQPKYREVEKPFSMYSVNAYTHRFGSWRKALEDFVTFMNQDEPAPRQTELARLPAPVSPVGLAIPRKTSRTISDRLRFKVNRRDGFRCVLCGASPAITAGVQLECDHIIPWSKGGETVFENLHTLCKKCNGGRSNLSLAGTE